jgi:hypothetical protein
MNEEVDDADQSVVDPRYSGVEPFITKEFVPRPVVHRQRFATSIEVDIGAKQCFPLSAIIGTELVNSDHS